METPPAPPLPPALPLPPPPGSAPVDRTWPVMCHITALAGLLIPFGCLLGPLVVWLVKRHEIPAVEVHGKESLNFEITMLGYSIAVGLFGFASCGIG